MIFLLLTAIVAIIVLSYTSIRACFVLFGAFSTLFQELLGGVQDFDLKTSIIEIPSFSTCATAVAQTILRISIVLVRACANAFLSLVWPIVDLEGARADLHAYAKFLMATYGPRKALPASPTWPSSTMDSKWIPSFGYGGVVAFSSATIPAFPAIPQIWVHHIQFGATMPLMLEDPPAEAPKPKQWLKILMALALILLSLGTRDAAFLWITKVMVLFVIYVMLRGIIQLVNRVFTTGRNVLFHRQRDGLDDDDHEEEEEEATGGDSVGTILTFSEPVSDSFAENDSFHGSPCEIVLVLFR